MGQLEGRFKLDPREGSVVRMIMHGPEDMTVKGNTVHPLGKGQEVVYPSHSPVDPTLPGRSPDPLDSVHAFHGELKPCL